jgi:hypothetical protein
MDFPYHAQTLGFQSSVMGQLLHPFRLAMIRDGETKYGANSMVTIPDLMNAMSRAVWSEAWGPTPVRNIEAGRRDLQRAYLDQMTQLVVTPATGTPADARAVARMQLRDVERRLAQTATVTGLNAYHPPCCGVHMTRWHLPHFPAL